MPEFGIELLGGFRVTVADRGIPDEAWRRRKPAALLKLLALAPRHRLHREQAMDLLWPELDPPAAAANLRKAVHQARRALDSEAGAELLASAGDVLCLSSEELRVDVDSFRAAVGRARRTGDPAAYGEAIDLYRDGLLPDDRFEEWAIEPRDDLHLELVAILEELAALLEARGDLDGAVRAVDRLVAAEPLREAAHAQLIRLHALAGRRVEALRRYEHLRALLAAELGAEPSAETQKLCEEVRTRQAAEPRLTAELWERVGELRVVSGDTAGAAAALASALAAGVPESTARLHRKIADAWLMQFDPEKAELHLRAAEQLGAEPAERRRLVRLRATQAWERGDVELANGLAEEAHRLADGAGDAEELAAAYETIAIVSHMRGDWRRGLQLGLGTLTTSDERAVQLARVFDIHHCIGQYHLYGDGLADDVEEYARSTLALAEQAEAVRGQAFAWCLLGESLLLQARWEEAAGCLERACDLHASFGTRSGALPWQRLAELEACRGAPDAVEPLLRRASAIATVSPMARHLWGRIYATAALVALERRDPEAAGRAVRAAAAAATRYGDCPSCSALLNPMGAEALAALGDREGARAYAEAAERVAVSFSSSAWSAMAESAAGSAALAESDADLARARFEAAAGLYGRAGQPYWQARSLEQAGSGERSGNGLAVASGEIGQEAR